MGTFKTFSKSWRNARKFSGVYSFVKVTMTTVSLARVTEKLAKQSSRAAVSYELGEVLKLHDRFIGSCARQEVNCNLGR